ncbi:MAG TPA: hypothetical protein VHW23_34165 [Kofleriaceae bacterium]|jgi:hypothetical protein|nr:hypothetical protein [Kofleriaceae bacterium]
MCDGSWIRSGLGVVFAVLAACRGDAASPAPRLAPAAAGDPLVGLWQATRRFGPDTRGPLVVRRGPGGWTADFLGRAQPVRTGRDGLVFELAGDGGAFRGQLAADGRRIAGHWTSPPWSAPRSRPARRCRCRPRWSGP